MNVFQFSASEKFETKDAALFQNIKTNVAFILKSIFIPVVGYFFFF